MGSHRNADVTVILDALLFKQADVLGQGVRNNAGAMRGTTLRQESAEQ